jgi:hypothetical protein
MPHLIELEDLPGFPAVLRRQQVEFIGWLVHRFGIYAPVTSLISSALAQVSSNDVTDLGSGSGGPILLLLRDKRLAHARFLLTDRFPPRDGSNDGTKDGVKGGTKDGTEDRSFDRTGGGRLRWHPDPVDALESQVPGTGLITIFNAFHHFSAEQQRRVLRAHASRGVLVFEVLQPSLLVFLKILITTTLGQLLLAPFVRPFRWERMLFTYLVPLNLITIPWDGLVSVLRSSYPETLMERLRPAVPPDHSLEVGTVGPWWAPVTWLRCLPEGRA